MKRMSSVQQTEEGRRQTLEQRSVDDGAVVTGDSNARQHEQHMMQSRQQVPRRCEAGRAEKPFWRIAGMGMSLT